MLPVPALRLGQQEPSALAIGSPEGDLTWADVAAELSCIAAALRALGLGGERRLAVLGENAPATLLIYGGAVLAGVGAVLINFHLTTDEVVYLLRDSGAGALWCDRAHLEVAQAAAAAVPGLEVLVAAPGTAWSGMLARYHGVEVDLDGASATDLLYTSGTTGFPKAVEVPLKPARSVAGRLEHMRSHHSVGLGPHLVLGPLYHGGPHAAVGLLLLGTAIVLLGRFDAAAVLSAVGHYRIASTVAVPTHLVRLLDLPADVRAAADLSSLRLVQHTGSPCPPKVKRAAIDWLGPILRESYGSIESGVITVITSAEWLQHPGSVGRAVSPFEVFVLDPEMRRCLPGQVGTVYVRDPTGRGIVYRGDPEKTAAAHIAPGTFTLGEMGHVDGDGYLYITDRSADMVLSGGVNIYPAECERVLLEHPLVADAAAFGLADPDLGERLVGVVVVMDPTLSMTDLLAHCRERLAGFKVPKQLWAVDEISRSPMGKIDKRALGLARAHP